MKPRATGSSIGSIRLIQGVLSEAKGALNPADGGENRRRRGPDVRSLRQLPYILATFVNLPLDLRHAFHLHGEFAGSIFDVTVHFGDERAAIL